mmetsp:Transcript_117401/g.204451  ORF Transcript_117401/g.204451 Transcript_117401/m.204451 type:complete len:82 (-) Transcript_117401:168-413(-)
MLITAVAFLYLSFDQCGSGNSKQPKAEKDELQMASSDSEAKTSDVIVEVEGEGEGEGDCRLVPMREPDGDDWCCTIVPKKV